MRVDEAAKIAHEVNRAYCRTLGDASQPAWEDAPDWQKDSAMKGIAFHWGELTNGDELKPSASHDSWLRQKEIEGWKYGPVKDVSKKEHPCFVPYEKLPAEQKTKDFLFCAVAQATFGSRTASASN